MFEKNLGFAEERVDVASAERTRIPRLMAFAALLVLSSLVSAVYAEDIPTAAPENVDPMVDGARAVETLDWDGDGDLDIVGAAFDGEEINVWSNQGASWLEIALTISGPAKDLAVGDLDGDGTTDFIYALGDSSGTNDLVGAVLNRSTTTYETIDGSAVDNPSCVALGDLDDDGDLDAVSCEFDSGEISQHTSGGDGETWSTVVIATPGAPTDALAHDVDIDGDLDVVVITSSKLLWLENRLNEVTTTWLTHDIDTSVPDGLAVAVGDIDGDGESEIIGGAADTPLLAFWNRPPTVTDPWTQTDVQSSYGVTDVDVGDADQDGDLDLLVTRGAASGGDLRYWDNDGSAAFTDKDLGGDYMTPQSTAPADFNGDGDLDFAIAAGDSDVIETIENRTIRGFVAYDIETSVSARGGPSSAKAFGAPTPTAYDLTDLDLDGDLDIVSYDSDEQLRFRDDLNDSGTLLQATSAVLNDVKAFELADIDNDGDVDVVMGLDDGLEWLENNGFGNLFSRNTVDNSSSTFADVFVLDLNRDGDLDIVGFDSSNSNLYWWRNTGDGAGWVRNTIRSSLTSYQDVTGADVTGDGAPELILAAETSVRALVRTNDTTFSEISIDSADASLVVAGDFDSDGDFDVAGYLPTGGIMEYWENDGAGGTWFSRSTDSFSNSVQAIAAFDADRDGDLDLFATSASRSFFLDNQEGATPFPALTFDSIDVVNLRGLSHAVGDLNSSGYLDVFAVDGGSLGVAIARPGQFFYGLSGPSTQTPVELGSLSPLANIAVQNLGKPDDQDVELISLIVDVGDGLASLGAGEVAALIERLDVVNTDGDVVVAELLDPASASPLTVGFISSAAGVLSAPPDPSSFQEYLLRVRLRPTYSGPISQITVGIDRSSGLTAEDETGLTLTALPSRDLARTYEISSNVIFANGFESEDTSAWSVTVP